MAARSGPAGITSADGYLWFTQNQTHQIGRLDPSTGNITEYSAPVAMTDLEFEDRPRPGWQPLVY